MRDDTFLKQIVDDQRNILYAMIEADDEESSYLAKKILLKNEGYTVPEIRMATNHHDANIRKWIPRLMKKVLKVLYPENIYTNPSKYLIIYIYRDR
jgi:glutaredoxin